jgi:diguanylate cyclase
MSLFKKSVPSNNDSSDKWKSNYLSLRDDYETAQKTHQDELDLLRKTIIRLSLATKGLNPLLDPYLSRIHQQLKNGLDSVQLQATLDEFSNAILQLGPTTVAQPPLADTTLLYDVLCKLYPEQQEQLSALQSKNQHCGFSSTQDLISACLDTLNVSRPGMPDHADNTVAQASIQHDTLTINQIITQLSQLLDSLEIPPLFETRAQHLKEQLHSTPSPEHLKSIIDGYIVLFQEIKKYLKLEQKDMTAFLSSLTDQLTELSLKASGATYAAQVSAKQRTLLDKSVSAQMSDLQKSSANATILEPLKQLIKTRLLSIRQEIQEHVKNEEHQRLETEKQLNELTLKIHTLDAESSELKSKLTAAYNKATRDTLTNLPNRLAYEEAISIEIARWKRYQTPLTLAIWDIDFFKKINDTYGHKAGDKALVIISTLLSKHCRITDFVARLGGEEFVMLLPNTTEQSALILANKIRLLIEQTVFNAGGDKINITISCGLSEFSKGDTGESVFERADQALYQSKENGRNQCIIAQ